MGSHRLAVAEIAALLVGAGAVVLDEAVASTGIVPNLVHLCFAHPANNALHACTLKLLRYAPAPSLGIRHSRQNRQRMRNTHQ